MLIKAKHYDIIYVYYNVFGFSRFYRKEFNKWGKARIPNAKTEDIANKK